MSRIEWIGGLVGLVVAILGLAGLDHSFLSTGLVLKLVVLGVAAMISIVLLTLRLENKTKSTNLVFGALALLTACIFFIFVAWMLATRTPITLREETVNGKSIATLAASYSSTNAVTIQLPTLETARCTWTDAVPETFPALDVQMVDWDSAIPKLHIDNFVHPQRVAIACMPPISLRGIIVDPPLTEMFLQQQINRWLTGIVILGGLIWLAAFYRLWASSP